VRQRVGRVNAGCEQAGCDDTNTRLWGDLLLCAIHRSGRDPRCSCGYYRPAGATECGEPCL
jgi:hypothetical protein